MPITIGLCSKRKKKQHKTPRQKTPTNQKSHPPTQPTNQSRPLQKDIKTNTVRYARAPCLYLGRSPTSCTTCHLDFLQQVPAAKAWAPEFPGPAFLLDVYLIAGPFFCIPLPCTLLTVIPALIHLRAVQTACLGCAAAPVIAIPLSLHSPCRNLCRF